MNTWELIILSFVGHTTFYLFGGSLRRYIVVLHSLLTLSLTWYEFTVYPISIGFVLSVLFSIFGDYGLYFSTPAGVFIQQFLFLFIYWRAGDDFPQLRILELLAAGHDICIIWKLKRLFKINIFASVVFAWYLFIITSYSSRILALSITGLWINYLILMID